MTQPEVHSGGIDHWIGTATWYRPRQTGPKCPCCEQRNMQRMGYCLYRCQESGRLYVFIIDQEEKQGYRMALIRNPNEVAA